MKKLLLGVCLFVAACSGSPNFEIPEEIASLENLVVIDPQMEPIINDEPEQITVYGDTDDVMIGRLSSFVVDEENRVYIADGAQLLIHAYSPDGSYRGEIGGEGDGPGEFRSIRSMTLDGQFLHVLDTQPMRISRFDLETLEYVDDMELPFEPDYSSGFFSYPQSMDLLEDGNYIVHFGMGFVSGQEEDETERNITGSILDRENVEFQPQKVYTFPASESLVRRDDTSMFVMSPPYKRTSQVNYSNGQLLHGWSEEILLKWYDINGDYSHAIYVPYENAPLDRNEVVREYADRDEPWRSMIRNDNIPSTWPVFYRLFPDDEERAWIGLYTVDPDNYTWQAYNRDGKIVVSFDWPRSTILQHVKNGYLFTTETDPDTGLSQVGKYRLE